MDTTVTFVIGNGEADVVEDEIVGTLINEAKFPADPEVANKAFIGWYDAATGGNKVDATTVVGRNMTVYAQYADTYTVTFMNGDTEFAKQENIAAGSALVYPATSPVSTDPSKAFAGWYDAAEGGNVVTAGTAVNESMTLYAQFANLIEVIFYDESSDQVGEPLYVGENAPFVNPDIDEEDLGIELPYYLIGWTVDGENLFEEGTLITEDLELFPLVGEKITVTFDVDGDTTEDYFIEDEEIVFPADPVVDGYRFAGWVDENDAPVEDGVVATENVTYYASFIEQITVTFMNGTVEFKVVDVDINSKLAYPAETPAAPADKYFAGWDIEAGTELTEDTIVNAVFADVPAPIEVYPTTSRTQDFSDFVHETSENGYYQISMVAPESTDDFKSSKVTFDFPANTDATNHTWLKIYYKTNFFADDQHPGAEVQLANYRELWSNPIVEVGTDASGFDYALYDMSKATDDGTTHTWAKAPGHVLKYINTTPFRPAKFADYQAGETYTIEVPALVICNNKDQALAHSLVAEINYYDGTTLLETKSVGKNSELTLIPDLEDEADRAFVGWVDEDGNPVENGMLVTGDMDIFAKFINIYTVEFYVGNDLFDSAEYKDGEELAYPADEPVADDPDSQAFAGWYTAKDGGELVAPGTEVTDDMDLYAQFADKKEVNFYVGEELYTTVKFGQGAALVYPEDPDTIELPEYVIGWCTADGEPVAEGTIVEDDIDLYAEIGTKNTVTFYANRAEYAVLYFADDEPVEFPADPEIEGFGLFGWVDANGDDVEEGIFVTEDTKLYAVLIEEFTVTFMAYGETYAEVDVLKGDALEYPAEDPVPAEGQVFVGWDVVEGTKIDADVVVNAVFEDLPSTVYVDVATGLSAMAHGTSTASSMKWSNKEATADVPAHVSITNPEIMTNGEHAKVQLKTNVPEIANLPVVKIYFKDVNNFRKTNSIQADAIFGSGVQVWGTTKIQEGTDASGLDYIIYDLSSTSGNGQTWETVKESGLSKIVLKPFIETGVDATVEGPYELQVVRVAFFADAETAKADTMAVSVVFEDAEGNEAATADKVAGALFSEPADADFTAIKTGSADDELFFVDWQLEDGTVVDEIYAVTEDIVVTPKYDVGNKITFMVDGETAAVKYVSPKAPILDAADYPADPAPVGDQFFAGWSTVDGIINVEVGTTEFTAPETTVYAQFRDPVEITYAFPDGNETNIHAYGAALVHLEFDADPEMDGMVFMGWALEEEPTVIVENGAFVVEEAVTFVPVFAYEVTFEVVSPVDDTDVDYTYHYYLEGEALELPEAPAKVGAYEFDTWVDANGDPVVAGTPVEAAVTYTASFVVSDDPITVIFMAESTGDVAYKVIEVPGNEVLLLENIPDEYTPWEKEYLLNPALGNENENAINVGPYNVMAFTAWSYTADGNFIIDENTPIETALSTTPLALNVIDVDEPVVVVPMFSTSSETPTDPEDLGYKAPVYYTTFVIGEQTVALETAPNGTIANLAALEAMARADEDQLFLGFVDEAGRKVDANTVVTANMLITPKYAPIIINPAKESLSSIVSLIGVMKKVKEHNGQPTSATGARPYRLYDGDELINCVASSHYEVLFEDGYLRYKLFNDTTMVDGSRINIRFPADDLVKVKDAPIILVGYRSNADLSTFSGDMMFYTEDMATSRGWGGAISPSVFNNSERWTTAVINLDGRKFTGGEGVIFKGKTAAEYNAAYPEAYHCGWDMRLGSNGSFVTKDKYLDIQYVALFETLEQASTFMYQPGIIDKAEYEAKKEADKKAAEEAASKKAAEEAAKAEAEAAEEEVTEEVVEVTEDAKENEAVEVTETTEAAE